MTGIIISFAEHYERRYPHKDLEQAISLWLLAAQQAYSALQVVRAYFEYCDACQNTVTEYWYRQNEFWLREYHERAQHAEVLMQEREKCARK